MLTKAKLAHGLIAFAKLGIEAILLESLDLFLHCRSEKPTSIELELRGDLISSIEQTPLYLKDHLLGR
ncbi:MAG: hypothetical protein ABL986_08045 [Vicinamibacterales bacterium]